MLWKTTRQKSSLEGFAEEEMLGKVQESAR